MATARAETAADHDVLALLARCVGRADLDDDDVHRVREAFVSTGARQIVEDKIRRLVRQAHRHLASGVLVPHAERRLHDLFLRVAGLSPADGTAALHLPRTESGSR
ncbi:hypothetical protein ABZV77_12460 [Streptomyces sp. NPDC004732]|uniref:hypothetical protein n=1 Tax=Streptomyces sp. NPDC004732 TaxID=3154290 RepID=UPI0033BCBD64